MRPPLPADVLAVFCAPDAGAFADFAGELFAGVTFRVELAGAFAAFGAEATLFCGVDFVTVCFGFE